MLMLHTFKQKVQTTPAAVNPSKSKKKVMPR